MCSARPRGPFPDWLAVEFDRDRVEVRVLPEVAPPDGLAVREGVRETGREGNGGTSSGVWLNLFTSSFSDVRLEPATAAVGGVCLDV